MRSRAAKRSAASPHFWISIIGGASARLSVAHLASASSAKGHSRPGGNSRREPARAAADTCSPYTTCMSSQRRSVLQSADSGTDATPALCESDPGLEQGFCSVEKPPRKPPGWVNEGQPNPAFSTFPSPDVPLRAGQGGTACPTQLEVRRHAVGCDQDATWNLRRGCVRIGEPALTFGCHGSIFPGKR